jgi:hypothetical protein
MKDYIIIPVNQTQGMEGYSAIAIEKTAGNIEDIQRMVKFLDEVRKLDPTISRITYDNPMVDLLLFNDDFTPMINKINVEKVYKTLVDGFLEEREFKVNAPTIEISNYGIKIFYDAEYTNSQAYCEFTLEEFNQVLTINLNELCTK